MDKELSEVHALTLRRRFWWQVRNYTAVALIVGFLGGPSFTARSWRCTLAFQLIECSPERTPSGLGLQARGYRICVAWRVRSATDPESEHTVDLSHFAGNGRCSCGNFTFERGPLLKAGTPSGAATQCKTHPVAGEALGASMVAVFMEETQRSVGGVQAKAGRADWPFKPGWNT